MFLRCIYFWTICGARKVCVVRTLSLLRAPLIANTRSPDLRRRQRGIALPPHICRHCGPALAPTSPLITASPPVPCRARMNRVYPRCPAHSRTPHVVYMLIVMRAQPPMSITFLFSHFRQSGHSSPALFVPSCLSNLRCGFGGGGGAC